MDWNNRGAANNLLALAMTMTVSDAFMDLYMTGWRPRRSIVFALWDGEDGSLIGSTEWVEDHMTFLEGSGVIYIAHDFITGKLPSSQRARTMVELL